MTHPPSLLQPKIDAKIRMTKRKKHWTNFFYALMLLHLPSPLTLGTVELDGGSRERSVLAQVKAQPAQSGFPANRTANSIHG